LENAANTLRVVVIDKGLPTDDLDPPLSPEILTGNTALLLKINEFEHGATQQNLFLKKIPAKNQERDLCRSFSVAKLLVYGNSIQRL
jgi:hypothetical protein